MSTRRARVAVAYATVKVVDPATGQWTVRGFYRDAVLPAEADPENVANLVRREYAEWVDDGPEEAPAADGGGADDPGKEETSGPGKPGQGATKPEWVAYAVTQRDEGVSEEDAAKAAEAKTKAELIAEFGG